LAWPTLPPTFNNGNTVGNPNGAMIDPVNNRLLMVVSVTGVGNRLVAFDQANGGWYVASNYNFASPPARGAMNAQGNGYLAGAATGLNQPLIPVTPDSTPGSFGYNVGNAINIILDAGIAGSGSGDMAFDSAGKLWMSSGSDLYSIDTVAGTGTRQTRPLLNG
jgi:hypothetical protein